MQGQQQKVVVITGASSGFGESAVRSFSQKGYRVWGTVRGANGRNAAKKAELEAISPAISVIEMDVAEDASVAAAFALILAAGRVDVLVNNAGIGYLGLAESFTVAQAHDQMNTNYYGVIRTTQAVLPAMRAAGGGLIINVSSIVGRISPPFFSFYSASKFALEAYSQSLRYEVAHQGIDIAIVEPGPFRSGFIAHAQQGARADVLEAYGPMAGIAPAMMVSFTEMLNSPGSPDPQTVVDAYINLAEKPSGQRPTRTVVGINWGVEDLNPLSQPIQDKVLQHMQLSDSPLKRGIDSA